MQPSHETYMQRCVQLARLGGGRVAPNPMVGAVLVYEGRIISEGYHAVYGGPHAEVACLSSVKEEDKELIAASTLYVSLEPCAHWGKTPPCADLIITNKISEVIVGCRDPFPLVAGKGIEKLKAAGIKTTVGVLEQECLELNKRFFLFHTRHRPYVVLKWAQTGDAKIAGGGPQRLQISSPQTARLVHRWRSQEVCILVGTKTALHDDPELTVRLAPGLSPIRLVVDLQSRLPQHLKLFDGSVPTIVFNLRQHTLDTKVLWRNLPAGVHYYQVAEDASLVHQIMNAMYQGGAQSLFVEGGAQLQQSFIDEGTWDEARVITNESMIAGEGLPAPALRQHRLLGAEVIATDAIHYYKHNNELQIA